MDDSGTCSYSKLKKNKTRGNDFSEINLSVSNLNISPPKDAYNIIYFSFILGGAGFLFPYNSFIMAMDYFKIRYPGTPVVFDMSLVYIVTAFVTVLGNNLLVETFSSTARINFGYIMSFLTLVFVVTCEVSWEAFGAATSYTVNLGAVAVVAIGCTVQQSSFYGYTSMLPARYTQAVMVGESVSGVFTSAVRVLTKFAIPEIKGSTIYFFTISILSVGTCFITYHIIRKSDFIQFYMALYERAKTKIVLEPTEDAGLMDSNDLQYGMLKIQNSPPANACLSFTNPVYEPTGQAPTFKVEDIVIKGRSQSTSVSGISDIKRGLQARLTITKAIYPYMISICLVYFATLCLYPGIASEIVSCRLGTWMPIIMMSTFNGADLLGKVLAASSWNWTGRRLVEWSVIRLLLIPMMLVCTVPCGDNLCATEIFALIYSLILGVSNGILGSVPMIQAPSQVEDCNRELTGNLMTLLYNFGLISGSLMAYLIESFLPHVLNLNPCSNTLPIVATTILPINMTMTTRYEEQTYSPTETTMMTLTNFTLF